MSSKVGSIDALRLLTVPVSPCVRWKPLPPQVVTVVKMGGGLKGSRAWSTAALLLPSGTPVQRPGTRSLRSTLTNLPLITKPATSSRSTKVRYPCRASAYQQQA